MLTLRTSTLILLAASLASLATAPAEAQKSESGMTDHHHDWDWLVGSWSVRHHRLKARLAGNTEWEEFAGTSALWLTLDGLGTIDDNLLEIPSGTYRAVGLRAFDAKSGQWSIWWLDARDPTHLDPPVHGGFKDGVGTFFGDDTLNGRPIKVRFQWSRITPTSAHWEQAFSPDGGATWETNWRMDFVRTSKSPDAAQARTSSALAHQATPGGALRDFDFLVGHWKVRHRKLKARLAGSTEWDEFGGTLVNWPTLGGQGNVGDNVMGLPGGTYRGVGFRAFDAATNQWLVWWLDSRMATIDPDPLRGSFSDGVGTFVGDDTLDGRPVKVRVRWSAITPDSAHWEQACSPDGGTTWEVSWTSDFTRARP